MHLQTTSARTTAAPPAAPAATNQAKPAKVTLSVQKLKETKAKRSANKPKLAASCKEVKQSLAGERG